MTARLCIARALPAVAALTYQPIASRQVARHADALFVERGEAIFADRQAAIGRLLEPLRGGVRIARHAATVEQTQGEFEFGAGVARCGAVAQRLRQAGGDRRQRDRPGGGLAAEADEEIAPVGVVSRSAAETFGVGAAATLAAGGDSSDFCNSGAWPPRSSITASIATAAISARPSSSGRRRAATKATACPPMAAMRLSPSSSAAAAGLAASSASAAWAARRAAAIWALIALFGGAASLGSAARGRGSARTGLEQEIGAVERARRSDRRRALGQIARRGADGAERLFGETRRRAARRRSGGGRRRGSGRRGGARFVDAGDVVLEPAEPADHAFENVLDIGEARLGALVGIFLLGAQFGEAAADRRARRLHRPPRRIEFVDQIGDALFERRAGSGALQSVEAIVNDGDLAGQRVGVDADGGARAAAPIEPFGEQVGDFFDELDVETFRRPAFEPVAQRHQRLLRATACRAVGRRARRCAGRDRGSSPRGRRRARRDRASG